MAQARPGRDGGSKARRAARRGEPAAQARGRKPITQPGGGAEDQAFYPAADHRNVAPEHAAEDCARELVRDSAGQRSAGRPTRRESECAGRSGDRFCHRQARADAGGAERAGHHPDEGECDDDVRRGLRLGHEPQRHSARQSGHRARGAAAR